MLKGQAREIIRMRLIFALVTFLTLLSSTALGDDRILLTEPALLGRLEKQGLSLAARLGAAADDNASLFDHAGYKTIADSIASELESLPRADKNLGVGMSWSHRLFDARWLKSPDARFELTAVVPRLDRRPFHPSACGELRLIYRLSYRSMRNGKTLTSKLPFTLNLVHYLPEDSEGRCAALAQKWLDAGRTADSLTASDGPLAPRYFAFDRIKSLEVNLQAVRWPSTVRPEFGNHAEYLLLVFVFPEHNPLSPRPGTLENTPDVIRLENSPALRAELKDWILRNHRALDDGIGVLPEKFLATKALSIAPRGSERIANHAFSRLFKPADFATLPYDSHAFAKTPAAFLRRLNDLSCAGCHQGRSIAGFHLLGSEPPEAFAANSLAVRGSPHLLFDLARRKKSLEAAAAGKPGADARPLSERAENERGRYGARCGLGDPSFADWNCEAPLVCMKTGDELVGECLPPALGKSGDPCQPSSVLSFPDSRRDRTVRTITVPCEGFCETTTVGFPRGMCSNRCEAKTPDAVCGGIAILQPFNACLAKGNPFDECVSGNVRPAELRSCDEDRPCRDDYVCAKAGSGAGCIPPYFLFQLRVDGHPTGRDGLSGRIADRIERALR